MKYTLGEIATHIHAELHGDSGCEIHAVGTLENAGPGVISFLSNRRYLSLLRNTRAAAVILNATDREQCPVPTLTMDNPYLGFARVARLLNPDPAPEPGISPRAEVHSSAVVAPSASIGPHVTVCAGAVIAERVSIAAGCYIGEHSRIGADSRLYPNVSLYHNVTLGARAVLHSGVVIGADGFGIANDQGVWIKIPQVGGVEIGDDVEVGANTTIDRGALENTLVEDGVKIDNQVQIGHNVRIGAHTAIAGCVAIAGSTRIGKRCIIGGACGISGHIEIVDDVVLLGMTGVANSIREPGTYASGIPAMEVHTWRKNAVSFKQLHLLNARIRKIDNQE